MVDKRLCLILLAILLFTGCTINNKIEMPQNVVDQVVYNNEGNVQAVEQSKQEENKTTKVVTTTKKVTTTTNRVTTNNVVTTTQVVATEKRDLSMQETMLNLINQERTAAGLQPVKYDYNLEKAANIRAQEMYENNYFEHERPNGDKWYTVLDQSGIKYKHAGENLARGFTNVERAHTALMNSPSHKRNILMEDFKYVGIGLYKSGSTYYIVQLYKA